MPETHIRCPKCSWVPNANCKWKCSVCNTRWNTFDTRGQCPNCNKVYETTQCPKHVGGCGQFSLHKDWYEDAGQTVAVPQEKRSIWPWKNKDKAPVTEADRLWTEQSLVYLTQIFDTIYIKTLPTITPDRQYFDHYFTGAEADAYFLFERLIDLMQIKPWELSLKLYSEKPTKFSEGIVATPSENLRGNWKGASGHYVDNGLGNKEIWLEMELLSNPDAMIATLSHELAHYKLLGEDRMEHNDELLTDLTAIAFGFGIFKGNNYFRFEQWQNNSHHGWQMKRSGYLPEQVIAYAMAWLAHYRNEDTGWKKYLTKTMKKYFEHSYTFIAKNKDKVHWGEI